MIKKIINFFIEQRINISVSNKNRKYKENITILAKNKNFDSSYRAKWARFNSKNDHNYPYYCAVINGISSINYVPENIYYSKIEPVLNNKSFALSYADKNFYENHFKELKSLFPETILRGINGQFYDNEYNLLINQKEIKDVLKEETDYILKPAVETSGGAKVILIRSNEKSLLVDGKELSPPEFINYLSNEYQVNFVLQKKIVANSWYSDFNTSSLNTVRLYTYRSVKDQKVYPLQAVIRFGKPGSLVDNQAAGGLTFGINSDAKINSFALDKYGKKYTHFDFLAAKSNDSIPGIDEMKNYARNLASKYYYHRLLGFDFCVDNSNRVRLLEINCKNIEINFLQMNNGPLFGDFTDEIIDFCGSNKKSVVLDFYL